MKYVWGVLISLAAVLAYLYYEHFNNYVDEVIPARVVELGQCNRYDCAYTIQTENGLRFTYISSRPTAIGEPVCFRMRTYVDGVVKYFSKGC